MYVILFLKFVLDQIHLSNNSTSCINNIQAFLNEMTIKYIIKQSVKKTLEQQVELVSFVIE